MTIPHLTPPKKVTVWVGVSSLLLSVITALALSTPTAPIHPIAYGLSLLSAGALAAGVLWRGV